VNVNGQAIRFVPAAELSGVDYERHIFASGQVSTRADNWHDLFNALAWCRLPRLKAAMNALHIQNLDRAKGGRRGSQRDALTLFDESGVIISGPDIDTLQALARKDWKTAFVSRRESWGTGLQVLVCGHAILEKMLNPYKSPTAHALLLHTPVLLSADDLDRILASALQGQGWLDTPAGLSPLPVMGIPGWWQAGDQDENFYCDHKVFRPLTNDKFPAPVHFPE
jgi:hypothetical protein